MTSFSDIVFREHTTEKKKYKTIHPLSNLPINVPRDLLIEKYCKLLEIVNDLQSKNKILTKDNQILTKDNQKLREQCDDSKIIEQINS
jgi:hypothetical protein